MKRKSTVKPMTVFAYVFGALPNLRIGRRRFSWLAEAREYASSQGRGIRLRFV